MEAEIVIPILQFIASEVLIGHIVMNSSAVVKEGVPAILELSNGISFPCRAVGNVIGCRDDEGCLGFGELAFVTSNVGYVEAMTDPSYVGQILVFTSPLIGNYGVPDFTKLDAVTGLPMNVQSLPDSSQSVDSRCGIRVAGVIMHECCPEGEYSHYTSVMSIQSWLNLAGCWGIHCIDTRSLTQIIRSTKNLIGRVKVIGDAVESIGSALSHSNLRSRSRSRSSSEESTKSSKWKDFPTNFDRVQFVSTKVVRHYPIQLVGELRDRRIINLLVFDCGVKVQMLTALLENGVCPTQLIVVPFDYNLEMNSMNLNYDGIVVSNGPGNPRHCEQTIESIRYAMTLVPPIPILGVCLGHQLLSLAIGCETVKMPFGHRGTNQPCLDLRTNKCYVTSQNHGYVVVSESLPQSWSPWFVNSNDGSLEGIIHAQNSWMSVQFHPEGSGGPNDTAFVLRDFIAIVARSKGGQLSSISQNQISGSAATHYFPAENDTVLVIGSGGLTIGQAGEFDYSGSQAIKALKEANIRVILVNPNIATVQTSIEPSITSPDRLYCVPINCDSVGSIIQRERPQGLIINVGGQTALNVGIELFRSGILQKYNCRVLGTSVASLIKSEDRKAFCAELHSLCIPFPDHVAVSTLEEARLAVKQLGGYPVLVRAQYALGGLGSGFVHSDYELDLQIPAALMVSSSVVLDKDLRGWKEVEYEIVRDKDDNCIAVCNMENFDPLGVHTGDSIVVAPSQTLTDREVYMLRSVALKVIRHLQIIGECNIQFALDPNSSNYCVIEMNARLSRSSALASKATGYPLAYIATKLLLGHTLVSLKNPVNHTTCACFEPALDYVVVKIPRWDTQKFSNVTNRLGSSMTSVGEVMAIGTSFEEALQKAIRGVSGGALGGLEPNERQLAAWDSMDQKQVDELEGGIANPTNARLFLLAAAFELGYSVDRIHELSMITKWFLFKIQHITRMRQYMAAKYLDISDAMSHLQSQAPTEKTSFLDYIDPDAFRALKIAGFGDNQLASCWKISPVSIRNYRKKHEILPKTKTIDTLAGEYPAVTNYLYTTYGAVHSDLTLQKGPAASGGSAATAEGLRTIIVLGCGPYCIGSSVEFDWCAVQCVRELKSSRYCRAIIINCNPETVSTDYDESDALYFEEITAEKVLDIYEHEMADGIIISMGGQTPNNICEELTASGACILGTSSKNVALAEDRQSFSRLLDILSIRQPLWRELTTASEAVTIADIFGNI